MDFRWINPDVWQNITKAVNSLYIHKTLPQCLRMTFTGSEPDLDEWEFYGTPLSNKGETWQTPAYITVVIFGFNVFWKNDNF